MTSHTPILAILCCNCLAAVSFADSADDWRRMKSIRPRGYVALTASAPIVVDGRLDDAAWKRAAWTDEFVDIEGQRKPKPRFSTRAKMLWNDRYFYIAARMSEPHVWGTLTKHDSVIFHDNDFEVFIDPNGDNHEYYEFEMNALNTGWDLFLPKPYKNGGRADNGWEIPGLKTAVHVQGSLNDASDRDQGWSVEIAIPWKAMAEFAHRPSPPRDGDQWRVNFSRVEWRHEVRDGRYKKIPKKREDNWVWSPQGIIDMHRPERWGFVQFSRRAADAPAFRPDPSWPAREVLMEIYHLQKGHRQRAKLWAGSFEELKFDPASRRDGLAEPPTMKATKEGFEAAAIVVVEGRRQIWKTRQDSRIWRAAKR